RDGWSAAALLTAAVRCRDLRPSFTLLAMEPPPAASRPGWRTEFLVPLYEAADAAGLDPSHWIPEDRAEFLLFLIPSDTPTERVQEELLPYLRTALLRRQLPARVALHYEKLELTAGRLIGRELPLLRQLLDAIDDTDDVSVAISRNVRGRG